MSWRQVVDRLAKNSVICHLQGASVLKDEERWGEWRVRIHGRCFFSVFRWMSGSSVFDWRNIGGGTGTSTVEHGWPALVIGGIFAGLGCLGGLILSRSAIDGVWYRNGVPDWTGRIGIPAVVMMMMTVTTIVIRNPVIGPDRSGMMVRRSVTLRSYGSDAGARTIDGIPAKTGGGDGRGRSVYLTNSGKGEQQGNRQGAQKRDQG
jgi:hypothetical protein